MRTKLTKLLLLLVLIAGTSCQELFDLIDEIKPHEPQVKEIASGLMAPISLQVDTKGHVWVSESGTGNNDGRISVVTATGKVYPVIEGFSSVVSPEGGDISGPTHILLKDNILWILDGVNGKLLWTNVASWQPGDAPLKADELPSADIATFVLAYDFENDTEESHPYNLAFGPDSALYIVDAGANAIIRRAADSGALSVFATIPPVKNPTQIGPPWIDGVPTGIAFDGHKFFVTTLTGFPFPAGEAILYQIDMEGNVSVYQDGFTSLVDLTLGIDKKPVVLEYGMWSGQEFEPMTGNLIRVNGSEHIPLLEELNFPTSIERKGIKTYYVNSLFDGTILKVTL